MKKILLLFLIISVFASCRKENLVQPKKQLNTYKEKLKEIIKQNVEETR